VLPDPDLPELGDALLDELRESGLEKGILQRRLRGVYTCRILSWSAKGVERLLCLGELIAPQIRPPPVDRLAVLVLLRNQMPLRFE
jgi:hypothetical protein